MSRLFSFPNQMMTATLLGLVRLYQWAIAPMFFSGCCRFTPSCSHYAVQALHTHSWPRALGLITRRIMRCNPFGGWGVDLLPEKPLSEKKS